MTVFGCLQASVTLRAVSVSLHGTTRTEAQKTAVQK